MKKTLVIVLALALVLAASLLTLTACSGKEYEGEYSYAAWDYATWKPSETHKYGCKVTVKIQGDVIMGVTVHEDTAEFYNVSATWTDSMSESGHDTEGKTNWRLHGQEMADSFVGLTTEEVLKMKVYVSKYTVTVGGVTPAGQPITNGSIETVKYIPTQVKAVIGQYGDFGYGVKAGATQSAGRLVLAIQDAILKSQGKTENPNLVQYDLGQAVQGSYSYFAWDYAGNKLSTTHKYGCSVTVFVKDGKISNLQVDADSDTFYNVTSSESWKNNGIWLDACEDLYNAFIGQKVSDILAIKVDTNPELITSPYITPAGQPTGITGADGLMVAGATQSSGRLILAIQDALKKLAD